MQKYRKEKGFTLTELITVIAILMILSAVAIPNILDWLPGHRLRRATRDLFATFQDARLRAIKEGANTVFVFSEDGYFYFLDSVVRDFSLSTGEQTLARAEWEDYKSGVKISSATFPDNDDGNPAISFRPNGLPVDMDGNLGGGEIVLVNEYGAQETLIMTTGGSVQIE
jgi:prepilin-type N-terminal cleavage/methylation domain-containing protein